MLTSIFSDILVTLCESFWGLRLSLVNWEALARSPPDTRTAEDDPPQSADQVLTDQIISGGWIASDCESEGECDAKGNTSHSPDVPFEPPVGDNSRNHEHVPASEPRDVCTDHASEPVAAAVNPDANPAVPPRAMPPIEPHVNTEGHRKICEILLPELFSVLMDPKCKKWSPRDHLEEACYRSMPLFRERLTFGLILS